MAISVRKGKTLKRRFDAAARWLAWHVGWAGAVALTLCGLLWLAPAESWDGVAGLRASHWPVYAMVALMTASLLGWSFVEAGQDRIEHRVGKGVSAVLFVVLPVFCLACTLWPGALEREIGPDRGHPLWLAVRWYPPLLTMLCAAVFLTWKSRPRRRVYWDRGAGYALLLAPYALLFAVLELGVRWQWLSDAHGRTLSELGSAAIVLQIVAAFVIGAAD
ncbi:MAG: hypothetical protein HS108_04125 [Planctomycetes bacterium]|nr:hypothetical protein [Planctomycetota bacterium]MCL4730049.1 hypothetical protein [Planctomycetota bacterium]